MARLNLLFLTGLSIIPLLAIASSGDRNPTFQHCLRGCSLSHCDPTSQPIPFYLRLFGWTCAENCAYDCGHMFTDNIRKGSRYHQFYGKWAFYRLGPFQEPFSILMSIGNLYVNLQGIAAIQRRIRPENKLRPWLVALGWVQVNTWIWSTVFHARDTPMTERLDYFSATLTISFTLLYTLIRIFHLSTPLYTSRLLLPMCASMGFIVLGHFTYLLSFPSGSFPYGYHTTFNLILGMVHNILWVAWSLSFTFPYPTFSFPSVGLHLSFPRPYPPHTPHENTAPREASTPAWLVALTTLAMSLELWDFAPLGRVVDAHSLWHAATIPLTMAWYHFLITDALELEGSLMGQRGAGVGVPSADDGVGLDGPSGVGAGQGGRVGGRAMGPMSPMSPAPRTPTFQQLASGNRLSPGMSPSRSPGARIRGSPKFGGRED